MFIPTYDEPSNSQDEIHRSLEGESFKPVVVERDNIPYLPVFDTLERLIGWTKGKKITYINMPTHALLNSSLDSDLHIALNIGTKQYKEFVPAELEWLRNEFISNQPSVIEVPAGTRILVGNPAKIPNKLIDALTICLNRNHEINTAYLGQVFLSLKDEKSSLFLILKIGDAGKDYLKNILEDIGIAIHGTLDKGESINIQVYDGQGISSEIVANIKPFYKR
jgi:hypothetical protein